MRAGLSTIQQTLTQEAASVLNHSIADAARRNHGQTTPVHVAATLLASPTGYLRQACIRSHPNSSHPLQCRALELCFTVALERLPTSAAPSSNGSGSAGLYEPPISNALMAALKRAQAHQRRGCPENQQQPLLAVKVELEQLIISILDDPSVSRVMREASFSSPAVKAAIEQSLSNSQAHLAAPPPIGPGAALRLRSSPSPAPPQVNRNVYLNPRLQSAGNTSDQSATRRREDVRKVVDILLRNKKRNPVIVGDSEPEAVERELLQMIEKKEIVEALLRNVQVVSLEKEFGSDKSQIQEKMKDLENLIDARLSSVGGSRGVILDLGDLKWLVEQPSSRFGMPGSSPIQQQLVSETSKAVVAEMGKLLAKFRTEEAAGARVWVIGTATCETYLRCQVYHPSMENDWDLQAMPITARVPIPSMFPRLGGNKLLGNSTEALNALKNFPMAGAAPLSLRRLSENADPGRGPKFCSSCAENYEREAAKLSAAKEELEKAAESDAKPEQPRATLPQWMQMAKLSTERELKSPEPLHLDKDQDRNLKQKTENLQKKWRETCRLLHPSFHTTSTPDRLAASHPLIRPQPQPLLQPKLAPRNPRVLGLHQVNQSPLLSRSSPERRGSPPTSPVRTELGLGRPKPATTTIHESATLQEKTHNERVKDLANCISSEWQRLENLGTLQQSLIKQASALDADSFKSFFKGLAERVAWQTDAASVVATAVIQSKSGNPRRRGGQAKGDTWLLFLGPDRVGKRRMASALSELLCRPLPVTVRLGSRTWRRHNHPHDDDDDGQESDFRGKTGMDRVADAVRRNPLSVIVLEDFDQADLLVYGSLRRAMERGRLVDSHGREVSLGSAIFILTADWLPENTRKSFNPVAPRDEKVAAMAAAVSNWQLQLSVDRRVSKRRADWASDDERALRPRKEVEGGGGASLSFDLNMSLTEAEEEAAAQEASRNSSELTTEREPETRLATSCASPLPSDLAEAVDETVAFRPVDFGPLRTKVVSTIMAKFGEVVGEGRAVEVADDALDRIVGGVWFGRTGLEEWADRVLVPGFRQLRDLRPADVDEPAKLVRLTAVPQEAKSGGHDWLPARVAVNVDSL